MERSRAEAPADAAPAGPGSWFKRLALAAAMVVLGVNVFTGGPLLALWVGSRVQGSGPPKMGSIFLVAIIMAVICLTLARLLAMAGAAYDRVSGGGATVRHHVPWLRSMRGERPVYPGERAQLSVLERILVILVVIAFVAFEIWFFFFSSSPIDQRSGR